MDFLDEKQLAIVAEIEKCDLLLVRARNARRGWNVFTLVMVLGLVGAGIIGGPVNTIGDWVFLALIGPALWALWYLIDWPGTAATVSKRRDAAREAYTERLGRIIEYKREAEIDPHQASLLRAADMLLAAPEYAGAEVIGDRVHATRRRDGVVDKYRPEWVFAAKGEYLFGHRGGKWSSAADREQSREDEMVMFERRYEHEQRKIRRGVPPRPVDPPEGGWPAAIAPPSPDPDNGTGYQGVEHAAAEDGLTAAEAAAERADLAAVVAASVARGFGRRTTAEAAADLSSED